MDVYVYIFRMKGSLSQTHWHLVFSFLTEIITSILSRWHWRAFSRVALWLNQKEILSDLQQHQSGADISWTVCVFWSFTACDLNFNVMLSGEHFSCYCDRQTHSLYVIKQECIFASVKNIIYAKHCIGQTHVYWTLQLNGFVPVAFGTDFSGQSSSTTAVSGQKNCNSLECCFRCNLKIHFHWNPRNRPVNLHPHMFGHSMYDVCVKYLRCEMFGFVAFTISGHQY